MNNRQEAIDILFAALKQLHHGAGIVKRTAAEVSRLLEVDEIEQARKTQTSVQTGMEDFEASCAELAHIAEEFRVPTGSVELLLQQYCVAKSWFFRKIADAARWIEERAQHHSTH